MSEILEIDRLFYPVYQRRGNNSGQSILFSSLRVQQGSVYPKLFTGQAIREKLDRFGNDYAILKWKISSSESSGLFNFLSWSWVCCVEFACLFTEGIIHWIPSFGNPNGDETIIVSHHPKNASTFGTVSLFLSLCFSLLSLTILIYIPCLKGLWEFLIFTTRTKLQLYLHFAFLFSYHNH